MQGANTRRDCKHNPRTGRLGPGPPDLDCQMFAEPEDGDQVIQETNHVGLAIIHHAYGKDEDNAKPLADFAASFASSFASVAREDHLHPQGRPKLPRSPPSPSSPRQAKKRGPP